MRDHKVELKISFQDSSMSQDISPPDDNQWYQVNFYVKQCDGIFYVRAENVREGISINKTKKRF